MNEENYFNENEEYEDCLDGLLAFFDAIPKESIKLLNVAKYRQMLVSASKLKDLLCLSGEVGEIEVNLHREFNMGTITAEINSLTVHEITLFAEMIKEADNFEIYPLVNGNIKIGIAFQSLLKTIG